MSRCFPFPPPGYEKKDRIDDADFLTKEKRKEKRHKKDKEKKDKERSKSNRKDKKERKEKHKDKDRDKEKKGTSNVKPVEVKQHNSAEKFSLQKNGIEDQKYVQELGKRIRDEERPTESELGKRIRDEERPTESELGRRIRDEERPTESQFSLTKQRRPEIQEKMVDNNIGIRTEEKHRAVYKKEEIKKSNGQISQFVQTRGLENSPVPKFPVMDQKRVAKPMEKKDAGNQMENNKYRENNGKFHKHKDWDRESKNRDNDKEKKKEEKGKEINETCKELPKLEPGNIKSSSIGQSSAVGANHGKRKHPEINGFLLENGLKPSKLPRPVPVTQQVENGRKLELSQVTGQNTIEKQNIKINGSLEAQRPSIPSKKRSSSPAKIDENGKAREKPPHPDMKYLSEILTVPKVDLLELEDDEEWLFGGNSKKPKVDSSRNSETQQVWDKALRIESADVVALPYVIPF